MNILSRNISEKLKHPIFNCTRYCIPFIYRRWELCYGVHHYRNSLDVGYFLIWVSLSLNQLPYIVMTRVSFKLFTIWSFSLYSSSSSKWNNYSTLYACRPPCRLLIRSQRQSNIFISWLTNSWCSMLMHHEFERRC